MRALLASLSRFQPAVPLILRLVLGAIFIAHGFAKIAGGMDRFASSVGRIGFPASGAFAWAAALAEFLGGICLVAGLFTRYAALAVAIVMVVAITQVHLHQGLVGGYEFPLVLLAVAVALMLTGGGPLSFDKGVLHRDF